MRPEVPFRFICSLIHLATTFGPHVFPTFPFRMSAPHASFRHAYFIGDSIALSPFEPQPSNASGRESVALSFWLRSGLDSYASSPCHLL
ncbi:hypothetical protein K458DRAFT_190184 [Lentithecium fluviatile CBS 122367]|uniref:Uncharacterized protein n=1 Tax=Lentithecium fluviatile CBS 122367 TaxID=1168545 RepID=A0A6G1JA48_9PLEO|nr:hypothetical protein K458DRAFT_190184 [Lentithecium fluviatile CBS 122367]